MILDYNKLKQETKAIVVDIIERSALKNFCTRSII